MSEVMTGSSDEVAIDPDQEARRRFFLAWVKELGDMAFKTIYIKGAGYRDFAMVCIRIDSPWRWVVDALMPDADWQSLRDKGMSPALLGNMGHRVRDLVAEEHPELAAAIAGGPLEDGFVNVVVLDETRWLTCGVRPKLAQTN